ncbi:protein translocase subunit SecD [Mariprofundus ferrooxydans]|uniref:Protein translocase subunit SecD n=1 Tax=Mariprofundus ferrooxydans PV-1 TaxID=314345 RepID=Q0EY70_9PROT|nr:protein translocase subunit SecD [Mariprofundus ferrooxydans]EAU54156.1 protein-export membrane protein SecD [Mariprofundus ferrooxydans PV-1]KON48027.1 preprotein translocase subunit SecD [Mariprofundus ferrooxydans]
MHSFPRWKIWLILTVLVVSLMGSLPNIMSTPSWWPSALSHPMSLGLDLKGGVHLVLDVDVNKAVTHSVEEDVDTARQVLRKEKIRYRKLASEGNTLKITIKEASDLAAAETLLKDTFSNYNLSPAAADNTFVLTLKDSVADETRKFAVDQAIEVIRGRIDALGTTEPVIVKQGDHRILVQIPGYEDSARAKQLIGRTAELQFKLVDEKGDLEKAMAGSIPPGDIIMYGPAKRGANGQLNRQPYLLKKHTELSGSEIADARVSIDSRFNEYAVTLKFNSKGSHRFDKLTAAHVGERFAIILEGVVNSAPVIRERISGGSAQITGSFTPAEAHDLAIILRAGALPAPVQVVEERSIGPSLGQDSIDQGMKSIIIGTLFVLVFMGIYYRMFGMVANVALIFNMLLIIGAMSMIGSTLTLPGMAGIVLTIGMAVDANVLIFERIREELNLGKTPLAAIDGGYDKAFSTIIDANITTLIAAIVLFQFGSGPVKGFAVTLSVGILASMFTAITVTRAIIAVSTEKRARIEKLSI